MFLHWRLNYRHFYQKREFWSASQTSLPVFITLQSSLLVHFPQLAMNSALKSIVWLHVSCSSCFSHFPSASPVHSALLQPTGLLCDLPFPFAFPRPNVQTGRERSKIKKRNKLSEAALLSSLQVPFWGNNFGYSFSHEKLTMAHRGGRKVLLLFLRSASWLFLQSSLWDTSSSLSPSWRED